MNKNVNSHEIDVLHELRFVRLRCVLRAFDSIDFHSFPDSTFSRVVKAFTHLQECKGRRRHGDCSVVECPYPRLFSHQPDPRLPADLREHPPPAVAIDLRVPPSARVNVSELFDVGLMIAGEGLEVYPHLLNAIAQVGAQGLGPQRMRYELQAIYNETPRGEELIYTLGPGERLREPFVYTWDMLKAESAFLPDERIVVELVKPARVAKKAAIRIEDYVQEFEFRDIIKACCSRIRSIILGRCTENPLEQDMALREWGQAMQELAEDVNIESSETGWHEQARVGKNVVPMSGVMGEIAYSGALRPFLPILLAGELLQVGKHTSYGNGRYHLRRPYLASNPSK